MKRILYILIVLMPFLTGCAKVVTPVFEPGKHITFDINFRGDLDTVQTRYYIIMNHASAPQVPFAPVEFIEPGEKGSDPNEDYFGKYYPTWSHYIVLDGNTLYFVSSPYTYEAIPTKEVLAIWNAYDPKNILLTFDMSKLGTLGNRLYFDVITVDKETKMVKDNLSPLNNALSPYSIFTISDTTAAGSDEMITGTWEARDIINWRVLIQ